MQNIRHAKIAAKCLYKLIRAVATTFWAISETDPDLAKKHEAVQQQ